ncbi:MAG: response regulator [Pedosphaera sp.]|nr:response regulator [Pedosphaera sp.]
MLSIRPQRILVVDDEPSVREAIEMLLALDGHQVVTASDGEEAIDKYDPSLFDVVFTDFFMPGIKGDELALAIKQREPVRPVILLTAFPPTTVPSAIDLIVTKPFMLATLREALHKVLGA